MRQRYTIPPFLFNTIIQVLGNIWQDKEIKGIHIRKKEIKLSLFTDDMIVYKENPPRKSKKKE